MMSLLALLSVLPLALAAPVCSVQNLAASTSASASAPASTVPASTVPASTVPASTAPTPVTTSAAPTSTANSTSSGGGSTSRVSMGWFADWHSNFTVSNINWSGYNTMAYFTAQPDDNLNVEILQGTSTLSQFVSAAHTNNVKALLTIGGWDGSMYWSSSVATAQNRSTFASNVAQFAYANGLDGIDFDWEYPGKQGAGCNIVSSNDTANFLEFITELRQQAPNLTLSAAVSVLPFVDSTGNPTTNASGFAQQLDWIEIMNYDVFGSFSSVTGPNAPLSDSCSPNPSGSAASAVAAWTGAGFPADQIVLGVPAYSHSFSVPSSTAAPNGQIQLYTSFSAANEPQGDAWDYIPPGSTDICGNPQAPNGVFNFWALVGYGYLNSDGSVASGMLSTFDNCSQTPFLYDPNSQVLFSYDDPQSFTAKGQYISQTGLRGFAMYEVGGDYNNLLISAINTAMSS
ncbi:glycoside hydrolase family 18 protein [Pisolithus sp. B1]|nr:glycoside hydrolase family 18 protein [Pisolithus sp. B1]